MVHSPDLLRRRLHGKKGGGQNDHALDDGGPAQSDFAEDTQAGGAAVRCPERRESRECAAQNDGDDDHQKEDQIVKSFKPDLGAGAADVGPEALRHIPQIVYRVKPPEDHQQHSDGAQKYREQAEAPEEGDATHKAHEKRRIPQGRQAAADVGDQKDEKDHDMALSPSPGVHLQHRPDHQHGGTGGADHAGQQGPDGQHDQVDPRGTCQVPGKGNVAGHAEQAEQHDDKGKIVVHQAFQHRLRGPERAEECGEGQDEQERPGEHCREAVFFPPLCTEQRDEGDTQKQTGKRNTEPCRDHSGIHSDGILSGQRHPCVLKNLSSRRNAAAAFFFLPAPGTGPRTE